MRVNILVNSVCALIKWEFSSTYNWIERMNNILDMDYIAYGLKFCTPSFIWSKTNGSTSKKYIWGKNGLELLILENGKLTSTQGKKKLNTKYVVIWVNEEYVFAFIWKRGVGQKVKQIQSEHFSLWTSQGNRKN